LQIAKNLPERDTAQLMQQRHPTMKKAILILALLVSGAWKAEAVPTYELAYAYNTDGHPDIPSADGAFFTLSYVYTGIPTDADRIEFFFDDVPHTYNDDFPDNYLFNWFVEVGYTDPVYNYTWSVGTHTAHYVIVGGSLDGLLVSGPNFTINQPRPTLPDSGATAALLGLGVLGLFAVRRHVKAS
jgi:hypothetical protein